MKADSPPLPHVPRGPADPPPHLAVPVLPLPSASGRYIGIDFSGARDAGRRLWIAEGRQHGTQLVLTACRPARELPGSATERTACLTALVRWLRSQGTATVGIDLPFSLPIAMQEAPDYQAFIRQYAIHGESASEADAAPLAGAKPQTADDFRERCRELCRATQGTTEARRACEAAAGAPFSAWNLRLYRQTWHGLRELLAPLLTTPSDPVCLAAPYQTPPADGQALVLLEACPATWLKRQGQYHPYKGSSPAHRRQRETILETLLACGLRLPNAGTERPQATTPDDHATIDPAERILGNAGGDALDSLIALAIAWQPTVPAETLAAPAKLLHREGCVYG